MDKNHSYFTGIVEYAKDRRIGNFTWGSISARVLMNKGEFIFENEVKTIPNPTIWLNIKIEYDGNKLKPSHQTILSNCNAGKYILVSGARITHFEKELKDENGVVIPGAPKETRYNLEATPGCVHFSDKPYGSLNIAILEGSVREVKDNGQLRLACPYISKQQIKEREVLVINGNGHEPSLLGKSVFVAGSVFGKTPLRTDLVYVVGNSIQVIK